MSNEIRTQITEILAHAAVSFSTVYMGEKKNAMGGNTPMDQWACMFTRTESTREAVEFEFFTGTRWRKLPEWRGPGRVPNSRSIAGAERIKQAKPQAPHPADLLQSLILDSSASEQSFGSWCDDFGYSDDSRKALATYEACQRNADKLRGFFTRETLESLTSALQDY